MELVLSHCFASVYQIYRQFREITTIVSEFTMDTITNMLVCLQVSTVLNPTLPLTFQRLAPVIPMSSCGVRACSLLRRTTRRSAPRPKPNAYVQSLIRTNTAPD